MFEHAVDMTPMSVISPSWTG